MSLLTKLVRIRLRRGTTEKWADADPVLDPGEPGWDSSTGHLRIGDGVQPWSDLTRVGEDLAAEAVQSHADATPAHEAEQVGYDGAAGGADVAAALDGLHGDKLDEAQVDAKVAAHADAEPAHASGQVTHDGTTVDDILTLVEDLGRWDVERDGDGVRWLERWRDDFVGPLRTSQWFAGITGPGNHSDSDGMFASSARGTVRVATGADGDGQVRLSSVKTVSLGAGDGWVLWRARWGQPVGDGSYGSWAGLLNSTNPFTADATGAILIHTDGDWTLQVLDDGTTVADIGTGVQPAPAGDNRWYDLLLRFVGDDVVAVIDGDVVATATGARPTVDAASLVFGIINLGGSTADRAIHLDTAAARIEQTRPTGASSGDPD